MKTKQICLKQRPQGWPTEDCFEETEAHLPDLERGQMLLEILYLSLDPYMRGRMNDVKSYVPPFEIGKPLEGGVIARVAKSNEGTFTEGTFVSGMGHWAEFMVSNGAGFMPVSAKAAPLSYYLGILGMPGMTAYVGLKGVAKMKPGENVFVTAASGAVGQVVGQIAKTMGCRVTGSAGGDDKIAYLKDTLKFDDVVNYKTETNLFKAVQMANPKGIDVLFENVGGPMMEATLNAMNFHGRIALCGLISDYNATLESVQAGPRNLPVMVQRSIRMQGFIVFNYPELCKEWMSVGAAWLAAGKLHYRESVAEGLSSAPNAFLGLFKGENFGKQIVKVSAYKA